ncbi:hypothetical protein J2T13_005384, partial [Paenibacillus sp. DS2015]|uniref:hypothetical protein n=1 Tax=Paenibacillus sp. DS2015 TaxID=3373917 RepID=UPI003D20E174
RQLPSIFGKVREQMVAAHSRGYKDFLAILLLLREHSLSEVAATLETMNIADVTAAGLRQRLSPVDLTITETTEVMTTTVHAAQYDQLLQEVI